MALAGIVLGAVGLSRNGSTAVEVLRERLARGEESAEEYRERLELLGGGGRSRTLTSVAIALVVVGLLGVLLLGVLGGRGLMGRMMDNPMMGGGMMSRGGNEMMGGETRRSGAAPSPGAREVRIEAGELNFRPAEVRTGSGKTVNLLLVNEGHMFHTLTVPGAGIDLRARPGDQISAAFVAKDPGLYEFVCTVPGHAEGGMKGAIVVEAEG
jgi:plastocyanin